MGFWIYNRIYNRGFRDGLKDNFGKIDSLTKEIRELKDSQFKKAVDICVIIKKMKRESEEDIKIIQAQTIRVVNRLVECRTSLSSAYSKIRRLEETLSSNPVSPAETSSFNIVSSGNSSGDSSEQPP